MVLVGPDEDHPPLLSAELRRNAAAQLDGGHGNPHHLLQPLDGRRGANTAEEQGVAGAGRPFNASRSASPCALAALSCSRHGCPLCACCRRRLEAAAVCAEVDRGRTWTLDKQTLASRIYDPCYRAAVSYLGLEIYCDRHDRLPAAVN